MSSKHNIILADISKYIYYLLIGVLLMSSKNAVKNMQKKTKIDTDLSEKDKITPFANRFILFLMILFLIVTKN